jgi:hypothetical protein
MRGLPRLAFVAPFALTFATGFTCMLVSCAAVGHALLEPHPRSRLAAAAAGTLPTFALVARTAAG